MTRVASRPSRARTVAGGPYELREAIGVGGVARVFSAVDTRDPWGRPLAVKTLRSTFADDAHHVLRLEREAQTMASLSHPNIVKVVDHGYQDGVFMVVMEYIHGVSLARLMTITEQRRVQIPEPIFIYFVLEVLRALDYVHHRHGGAGAGLVHRDVSPGNVLVDYRGRVKLIDFGIARELDAPVSSPGRLRGKLGYLSPEQARGDRTDQRSDLFSLAVIMAELALQCRLFSGETPAELVSQALRADLSTLERAGSRVPFELELILSIALDADPEERFQSANELREVLDELVRLQSWTVPSARSVASWLRANRILEPVSGVRSIMLPGWLRAGSDENRHSA